MIMIEKHNTRKTLKQILKLTHLYSLAFLIASMGLLGTSAAESRKDTSFAGITVGASELIDLDKSASGNTPEQKNGTAYKYFFGYNLFDNIPLSLGYTSLGTSEIESTLPGISKPLIDETEVAGVTLNIGYELYLTDTISIVAGVGKFSWKATINNRTPQFVGGAFDTYSDDKTNLSGTDNSAHLWFKYLPDKTSGLIITLERFTIGGLDSNVATIGYVEHY